MSLSYPKPGDTYVPVLTDPEPITDDDIRSGTLVVLNEDGTSGLAEVKKGLVVSFVRVLVADGVITGPAPYRVNRFTRVVTKKEGGPG